MKIKAWEADKFVKNPNPAARVVLIYGPDRGLMRERAKKLGKTVVEDLNDPFNAVSLSGDELSEDPARLSDEASAMSMMGGARLIRIEDASDKISTTLKEYLENPSDQNLVIIEAGDLTPKSSLRKLCESHDKAIALPCYVDNEKDLSGLIRETLQHAGFGAEFDAQSWLIANLNGDRQRVRSELDKLVTYMGVPEGYKGLDGEPAPRSNATVTVADVIACCGEAGVQSFDDLVYSTAGGNPEAAFKAYHGLLQEGIPVITILRVLQNHFRRLHATRARIDNGETVEKAMNALMPRVFFKYADMFKVQLQRWSLPALSATLQRLVELEADCKKTGTPDETVCGQALLAISSKGRRVA